MHKIIVTCFSFENEEEIFLNKFKELRDCALWLEGFSDSYKGNVLTVSIMKIEDFERREIKE